jgi:hypothetical protein
MLQEFVWSEGEKQGHAKRRRERLKALGEDATDYPLFCFETAIKFFYFAALIYEYQEVSPALKTKIYK